MVESKHATQRVRRQGDLRGLNRPTFYYKAVHDSAMNQQLMSLIHEQFLRTPFCGWRKMIVYLRRLGYAVNGNGVRRLMRLKSTSCSEQSHPHPSDYTLAVSWSKD